MKKTLNSLERDVMHAITQFGSKQEQHFPPQTRVRLVKVGKAIESFKFPQTLLLRERRYELKFSRSHKAASKRATMETRRSQWLRSGFEM